MMTKPRVCILHNLRYYTFLAFIDMEQINYKPVVLLLSLLHCKTDCLNNYLHHFRPVGHLKESTQKVDSLKLLKLCNNFRFKVLKKDSQ